MSAFAAGIVFAVAIPFLALHIQETMVVLATLAFLKAGCVLIAMLQRSRGESRTCKKTIQVKCRIWPALNFKFYCYEDDRADNIKKVFLHKFGMHIAFGSEIHTKDLLLYTNNKQLMYDDRLTEVECDNVEVTIKDDAAPMLQLLANLANSMKITSDATHLSNYSLGDQKHPAEATTEQPAAPGTEESSEDWPLAVFSSAPGLASQWQCP